MGMERFAGSRGTNVSARGVTEHRNIFFTVDFGCKQEEKPQEPSCTDKLLNLQLTETEFCCCRGRTSLSELCEPNQASALWVNH